MEDYKQNSIDDIEEDDDELDLVALVTSNANNTSQYLVFQGSDNQYYAKNVSKIEELLVYKDIDIVKSHGQNLISGTADIRGNMTTIIHFDQWFGNKVLDDTEYELVIVANYGGHRLGIVVKSVEYIVNIPPSTMTDNSQNDEKTSFITKVRIGQKEEMCIIFDSDKMLIDTFNTIDTQAMQETQQLHKLQNSKLVLFADDSRFIRKMAEDLFKKMDLHYKIYKDGKELVDDLQNIPVEEIGLFITDLEMPVLGGKDVIAYIRQHPEYDKVNIIVHTNMSNDNMNEDLKQNGAQKIIGKVNMLALSEAIEELMV